MFLLELMQEFLNQFSILGMWFYKFAHRIPLILDGKQVQIEPAAIEMLIKRKLLKSQAIRNLFQEFDVDPARIRELRIQIVPLDGIYAETDAKVLKLNTILFEDGSFFDKHFFIVAHEIVHWLSRIREQDAYFNDPEEVLGFVSSIAYEIEQKEQPEIIWKKIFPKISWHFNNEHDAKEFFENMVIKAKKLISRRVSE